MKSRNFVGTVFSFGIVALVLAASAVYALVTEKALPPEGNGAGAIEKAENFYEEENGQIRVRGAAYGRNREKPIIVEVTITSGKIIGITVLEHNETSGLSDPAFQQILPAIIEAQSSSVDTVSGATDTSRGIMEAVENALNYRGKYLLN